MIVPYLCFHCFIMPLFHHATIPYMGMWTPSIHWSRVIDRWCLVHFYVILHRKIVTPEGNWHLHAFSRVATGRQHFFTGNQEGNSIPRYRGTHLWIQWKAPSFSIDTLNGECVRVAFVSMASYVTHLAAALRTQTRSFLSTTNL